MLRKSKKIFFMLLLLLLILNTCVYATENVIIEYSERYLEYLELSEDEKEKVSKPLPFDIVMDYEENRNTRATLYNRAITIPSKYDLRNYIDIEVENQKEVGVCWAFAALSAAETNAALQGRNYEFSERHLDYEMASDYQYGKRYNISDRKIGEGGNSAYSFQYFVSGLGPILQDDLPFENNATPIEEYKYPKNKAVQKVNDMIWFPNIYKSTTDKTCQDAEGNELTESQILTFRNEIKEHIMNNGGIIASINGDDITQYNSVWGLNSNSETSNHEVLIIGWDDNYSRTNFATTPRNNGAYLALNSWGESWNNGGAFYISYEDTLVESNLAGVKNVSNIEYDNVYQYDDTNMIGRINYRYAANIFTASENEILTEVSIGSTAEETCDVYINPTSYNLNINAMTKIASNVTIKPGYNTVKITNGIQLTKGSQFVILVQSTRTTSNGFGVSLDKSNSEESVVSIDGTTWYDIYDEENMMNLCINGYTKVSNKSTTMSEIKGKGYQNIGGMFSFSLDTSYTNNGKNVDVQIFKNGSNVTSTFGIIGNKVDGKGAFVKLICPTNVQSGTYEVKCSIGNSQSLSKTFNISTTSTSYKTVTFKDANFYKYVKSVLPDGFEYDSYN